MNKCPFPHPNSTVTDINTTNLNDHSRSIAHIFRDIRSGIEVTIDNPEKEQALFAYHIYQLANNIGEFRGYMNSIVDAMRDEPDTYQNLTNETR
jgi:hypothetical protein